MKNLRNFVSKKAISLGVFLFVVGGMANASTGSAGDVSKVTSQLDKIVGSFTAIFGSVWVSGFLALVFTINMIKFIGEKNSQQAKKDFLHWMVGAGGIGLASVVTGLIFSPASSGSLF